MILSNLDYLRLISYLVQVYGFMSGVLVSKIKILMSAFIYFKCITYNVKFMMLDIINGFS
jgi:hypothetical protein